MSRQITADKGPPAVPTRQEIEQHLDEILSSPAFKGSVKGTEFLRFVVGRHLNGETHSLHERAIAIDLLGKDPAYEPSEDASVRVRANEVRKRLASFYQTTGSSAKVRIDLPAGGYVPQFRRTSPAQDPPLPVVVKPLAWRFWAAGGAAAMVLSLTILAIFRVVQGANTPLETFWQPVYNHRNPVVLCIPGLRALYPQGGTEVANLLHAAPLSPAAVENLVLHGGTADLYVQDEIVGMGASLGAIQVASHLARKGKPVLARISQDVSFADLRSYPAVLLGGSISSTWTHEMNQDMPFVFVGNGSTITISESRPPRRSWSVALRGHSKRSDEDYAIVGRIIDSKSGQIILLAGGLTTFGTQSAAECLVENDCIARITAQGPRDWASRNIEAVIHTRILGNTPGPPQLVTAQFW
jgi:hypothetical protein